MVAQALAGFSQCHYRYRYDKHLSIRHEGKRAMQKVTAAVIERDGKVLIARRRRGDPHAGKWEFPGGKLEPGVRRELREELGIETEIGEFLCSIRFEYPHVTVELLVYRTSYVSGEITPHEHDRVEWIAPEALREAGFSEADKPVVRKLKKEARSGP